MKWDSTMRRLIGFVQSQFVPSNLWCWETIFEEVSATTGIELDADRLIYAGGTLRTGIYEFRCNNAAWRKLCTRIAGSDDDAHRVVHDVVTTLMSEHAHGTASAWLSQRKAAAQELAGSALEAILSWQGFVYHGKNDFSPELRARENVIYGLWRLGKDMRPISPIPLNVGESLGTVFDRIYRNHVNWWGPKSIGVTVVPITPTSGDRADRKKELKRIEKSLQDALIPFANCDGRRLGLLKESWQFQRPQGLSPRV